ncbi:hypothetical protein SLA2020_428070 [Shorea laevis]
MERWRSSTRRSEALEIGGGPRLRPELVEVNRSGLEKTRSVNRYRSVKRPARVSGVAAEGSAVMGMPSMGGGAATVITWRKEKQNLRKKLPEDKGRKIEKEARGRGRREGKRSRPPPLQSHRKWRRDLTKRRKTLLCLERR